jgi:8-oxo-dGTP diphosphatase
VSPADVLAVAAAVVVHAGRVLVQTRPEGSHYAGYWEFPGGKLEPGEDTAECAVRECAEELGLAVTAGDELHRVGWTYPGRSVDVTFVLCTAIEAEPDPQPCEGQQLRWADVDDLQALQFLPANAEVLAILARLLTT